MARFSVSGNKRKAISSPSSSAGSCGNDGKSEPEGDAEERMSKTERFSETLSVTIDPETMDCPICFEPLSPPVYQCRNGHVTCSACCTNMKNKCYVCPYSLGPGRCVALEKVLESVRTPCPYADKGCRESTTYAQRNSHKSQCNYSPCFCPFPGCEFEGHLPMLSTHFKAEHTGLPSFKYNVPFQICLRECSSVQILLAEDDVLYVIQNSRIMSIGNSVTLNRIHPNMLQGDTIYELKVATPESSLTLSGSVLGLKKWEGVSPSKEFLLVPRSLLDTGRFDLEVIVRRSRK